MFITGGTGFVGSHVVRRLVQERCDVAVLLRSERNRWRLEDVWAQLTVVPGSLADILSVAPAITAFKPDVILHLGWAGANSYRFQNLPEQVFDNVPGSLELIRLAAECEARKFVGMGSVIEYGSTQFPVDEEQPARPHNLYGAAKYAVALMGERLAAVYGMQFAWFRLYWAYGPGDDAARMIPSVIMTLLRGEKPSVTKGEQYWDYLYIDDLVDAVYRVAVGDAVGTFNLGSGEPHTVREVVECIRDQIDPSLPIGFGEVPYRPDQIMFLQADITRLRKATGWQPTTPLAEGIRRTVEWYRRHSDPSRAGQKTGSESRA